MSKSRPIGAICEDLQDLLQRSVEDPTAAFDLAAEVEVHPKGINAVGLLLSLLEKNPDIDWGTPGPLVHAVEAFFKKGYEPLLVESVSRTPTCHTLWMANRVVNGVSKPEQAKLLAAIREAATRKDVSKEVRQTAKQFLEFQDEA
jgi:hypothetical protein